MASPSREPAAMPANGQFAATARGFVAVGAAPPDESVIDEAFGRHQRGSGLSQARALLDRGPAGAVENVEEL